MKDDHSIENEPHLQQRPIREEPMEPPLRQLNELETSENSVWDEPHMEAPVPADAVTYRSVLERRLAQPGHGRSWLITLGIALISGPLAILGTFFQSNSSLAQMSGGLAAVFFAPLVEEIMKNAGALWVVESHPHWFRSRLQIAVCVLASGAAFAAVENLLYLHVYIPNPPPELVQWRWTVCVALHMGCALVAGLGTMRIWRQIVTTGNPNVRSLGLPAMVAAIALHGLYNGLAILWETLGQPF